MTELLSKFTKRFLFNGIVVFTVITLIVFTYSQEGFSAARYPCCIEWSLDKTEYMPGDTVTIDVRASNELIKSQESITATINEVTFGPDYSNKVFEETKTLQGKNLSFKYKIPENTDRYRYLVSVDTPSREEPKMFFSKKDASKIVISDLNVINPIVKQGESIKFKAKVVDGVGNPSHYISMSTSADIPHQNCGPDKGWAGAHVRVSPLYSVQPNYWSEGILEGELTIDDTAKPGKYNITLFANGEEGYKNTKQSFVIEIQQNNDTRELPFTVFAPRETDFDLGFPTENPIEISGKTAYNGCGPTIPNVPIKAEIKRYDLRNSQWMETLVTQESISDESGEYYFYFEPLGLRPGYYTVHLTSNYEGVEQTVGSVFPNNIKNFTIIEEGKEFQVRVDGHYFIPENVSFDKERKTLTIDLDTAEPFRSVDFSIPSELLSGEFTIFVNGIERDGNIRKTDGHTHFSPWPGEDDHTTIEVIGTSAIPEFQTIAMMILALSIIPMILLRKQKAFR